MRQGNNGGQAQIGQEPCRLSLYRSLELKGRGLFY